MSHMERCVCKYESSGEGAGRVTTSRCGDTHATKGDRKCANSRQSGTVRITIIIACRSMCVPFHGVCPALDRQADVMLSLGNRNSAPPLPTPTLDPFGLYATYKTAVTSNKDWNGLRWYRFLMLGHLTNIIPRRASMTLTARNRPESFYVTEFNLYLQLVLLPSGINRHFDDIVVTAFKRHCDSSCTTSALRTVSRFANTKRSLHAVRLSIN